MRLKRIRWNDQPVMAVYKGIERIYKDCQLLDEGTLSGQGVTITIDHNGIVTITGKASANVYVRLSPDIKMASTNTDIASSNVLIPANRKNTLSVDVLEGTLAYKPDGLNVLLRDSTNAAKSNCKIASGMRSVSELSSKTINVVAIYVQGGYDVGTVKFAIHIESE